MDMASITAAYNGLKFGEDFLTSLLNAKIEPGVKEKASDVLAKLGQAQDTLFELREQLFALQADNDALRKQVAEREAWDSTVAKYELSKTSGGAVVYAYKGEPEHYACPSCIQERRIQILQDRRAMTGLFECPACKARFPVNPPSQLPPIPPTMRTY